MPKSREIGSDHSIRIECAPARVLAAFFDPSALAAWCRVAAVVATPRPLGAYAIEWQATGFSDDLLGPLGGVFHGTVIDFQAGRGFFVADGYWLPPDGDPVGPMALEVTCTPADRPEGRPTAPLATTLRVVQRGLDDSPRWLRYYEVTSGLIGHALERLKVYLEHGRGAWDLRRYE
jgi:hypothetical protein